MSSQFDWDVQVDWDVFATSLILPFLIVPLSMISFLLRRGRKQKSYRQAFYVFFVAVTVVDCTVVLVVSQQICLVDARSRMLIFISYFRTCWYLTASEKQTYFIFTHLLKNVWNHKIVVRRFVRLKAVVRNWLTAHYGAATFVRRAEAALGVDHHKC